MRENIEISEINFCAMIVALASAQLAFGQKVFGSAILDAIGPAEVSIAINPKNPDNIVAASFAFGRPPRPQYGSYNYSSMDGGQDVEDNSGC